MKILQAYGSAVILVVVALVIILPLLAYLQYSWLGQMSEQEYERMKENLQTTAYHCSMDFSREIIDLMKSLGGNIAGSDDEVQKIIRERIITWKAQSTYPAIVSPKTKIGPSPSPAQAIRVMATEGSQLFLLKDLSAIALLIQDRPSSAVLVSLNREYISSVILPKLIQTDFPSSTRSEYDIIIINERGTLLYSSLDTTKHDIFQKADLRIPFLIFPPTLPASMPPMGPDHEQLRTKRGLRPEPFDGNPREFDRRHDIPPPQEKMEPRERERGLREGGLFEMRLINREGSLEAAVNNNRLRNIGISFGVLLLLGASIVFLLLSTNRARRLARQQLEFVAGISHELRTPLAVLKSAGENLADGVIQEKDRTRKYGELIKNEVLRLSDMVEKALAYAGIQSGNQKYELRPLDLEPIITEALQNAQKLLPSYTAKAETDIEAHLPQVLGNAAALQSALENLIINGIKYSVEKEWIHIEAYQVEDSQKSFVKIKVEDHGRGITPVDISNIFKPFYRGRNAIEGQIQGSGLGLSITKHIIESHGGKISVKSSPNEGSVFTILLPALAQDDKKT
jgi:signal transduction histidine kinase/type II secretory pathway pseudopilin PulG